MTCAACGREGPDGVVCTFCGQHRETVGRRRGGGRWHVFAASPHEHVVEPGVISTLFPHLGRHRAHDFRLGLLLLVAVTLVLLSVGLVSAALLVACLALPVLFVVYLVDSRLYAHRPLPVLLGSIGWGLVAGLVVGLLVVLADPDLALAIRAGTGVLLAGVLLPLIDEVVKPLGVLALCGRRHHPSTLDGQSFGMAAGLAYGLASVVVAYHQTLAGVFTRQPLATGWFFTATELLVLLPLLQGCTTAIVCATWWRGGRGGGIHHRLWFGLPVAVAGHIAFSLGGILLANASWGAGAVLVWEAIVVVPLIVLLRVLQHEGLMAETAAATEITEQVCANCHRHVFAAGFCAACGMALDASPRRRARPLEAG